MVSRPTHEVADWLCSIHYNLYQFFKVKEHIAGQKEHHTKVEFSEEMIRYLIGEVGEKTWAEWFDDANNTE